MNKINYIIGLLFAMVLIITACEKTEYEFGDIVAPSGLAINYEIVGADDANPFGDGTGKVNFTATSNNTITYKYLYNSKEQMAPLGTASINFSTTGVHTYLVTVEAIGVGGVSATKTIEVEVLALYEAPADLLEMLTGGSEKSWRVKAESAGHLGVGPTDGFEPIWWAAAAFDKEGLGCYDDRLVFNIDGTYTHITNDTAFGQEGSMVADFGIAWEANPGGEFENYPLPSFSDTWELTAPDGQETLSFGNNGYHGFYVGGDHSYSILMRSETEMSLRTIGADGNAWYAILTTETPEEKGVDVTYTTLLWSDEFDTDGAPDPTNWTYDLGTNGGWGNGEAQYYTDRTENVSVADGLLKITAIKENYSGSEYTSTRLKTAGLREFTYGRIDVRAKLPNGGGTWPAIWMLGANFSTAGWPNCGEIDIMEHVGNDLGVVQSAIHTTSSSGATVNMKSTSIEDETTEFHVYSMNWSENEISFLIDDELYYTYNPETKDESTWPFDADQFLILNVAMGGTLGGDIDAGFTAASMEIDYVRVYQ